MPAGALRGAAPGKRPSDKAKEKPPTGFAAWWPLIVGVALDFIVPELRAQLATYDPWVMRAVFPLVQIFGMHELGFSDEMIQQLPQLMQYLQFPLEGLLTGFNLSRGTKLGGAIGQLIFLHALCLFVMWLLAQNGH